MVEPGYSSLTSPERQEDCSRGCPKPCIKNIRLFLMQTAAEKGVRLRPLNTLTESNECRDQVISYDQIEAELRAFESRERERLGLSEKVVNHWVDSNPREFTKAQREGTTVLCGGLTRAQDYLISGALRGVGYHVVPLDVPDNEALRLGKEF